MVDPINFTDFNRTDIELEEMLLFSVLVAGKNALTTAKLLEDMLVDQHKRAGWTERRPFRCLLRDTPQEVVHLLKKSGFGCYQMKGRAIFEIVHGLLNLRTCSVEDLEKITGIGPKTARMFILHSRKNATCAALDVHILRYLQDQGYNVPSTTPGSKKLYRKIEQICVQLAKQSRKSVARWDLDIWREYREKPNRGKNVRIPKKVRS
jgi:endonuclease III